MMKKSGLSMVRRHGLRMHINNDHHQMMVTTVLQHTQAVEVVATSIVMEVGDYILVSPS
jgi:hypothetical protein